MPLAEERLRSIIESLLLVSADPVPISRLVEVIRTEDPTTEAETIMAAVQGTIERYLDPDRPIARGFRVEDVGGALQLRTTGDNGPYVRTFLSAKPQRLSKPALETLAIIAYRQPVTKPEVEAIRGVDSGAVLKQLLERDLVRIIGKREEVGRPIIYGTTKYFLEFFGVRSLAELPTLREYHELDEEHQREVDALHGAPKEKSSISELANAATFLNEVKEDPDLDALDLAVAEADRARRAADFALDPTGGVEGMDAEGRAAPEQADGDDEDVGPGDGRPGKTSRRARAAEASEGPSPGDAAAAIEPSPASGGDYVADQAPPSAAELAEVFGPLDDLGAPPPETPASPAGRTEAAEGERAPKKRAPRGTGKKKKSKETLAEGEVHRDAPIGAEERPPEHGGTDDGAERGQSPEAEASAVGAAAPREDAEASE